MLLETDDVDVTHEDHCDPLPALLRTLSIWCLEYLPCISAWLFEAPPFLWVVEWFMMYFHVYTFIYVVSSTFHLYSNSPEISETFGNLDLRQNMELTSTSVATHIYRMLPFLEIHLMWFLVVGVGSPQKFCRVQVEMMMDMVLWMWESPATSCRWLAIPMVSCRFI